MPARKRLIAWTIGLVVVFSIPLLLQNISVAMLSRLCLAGIYAMLILGLDLLLGYAGQVNLGQQGFFGVGAYVTAVLTTHRLEMLPVLLGEPIVAMIVGIIITVLIASVLSIPVVKTTHFYQAMVTLAFGMILFTICNGWREVLGGPGGIVAIPPLSFGQLRINSDLKLYYVIWALLLAMIVFSRRLMQSRWGLACQALRSDEAAASVMGINLFDHKFKLFILSSIYASIAGSLFAHFMRVITPYDFDAALIMVLFLGLYFGGVHSLWGSIIGAVLLQIIPEVMTRATEVWPVISELREIIYGLIFILIIFYMPKGILNTIYNIISRRKSQQEALAN